MRPVIAGEGKFRGSENVSRRRKFRRRSRALRSILIVLLMALAIGLVFFSAVRIEKEERKPETRGDYHQRYTYDNVIEVGGVSYRQRKELTTILLMGIDQDHDAPHPDARSGGQADFLRLLIVDPSNKKVTQLALDRDTMTPITILSILGDRASVRTWNLCLSHAYGDGKEQSCAYSVDAVSNLLFGTKIDHYVAMNLDGISVLNDWAGGVTVTLRDDFSAADPDMTPGKTLKLVGNQAEIFVRSRMDVGDGTNAARMERQNEFLQKFRELSQNRVHEDKQSIGELYDSLAPYLTTDMTRGRFINEAWAARDYEVADTLEIKGTHVIGDAGFVEYYPDEEYLQELVLKIFYEALE